MSGINRDEWLRALTDAGMNDQEHDPNAITIGEFEQLFGVCQYTARRKLEALVAAGKARKTKKKQLNAAGRMIHYIAYRLESK